MKFKGWCIEGPSYVKMKEFDTEVGKGLIPTEDPAFETTPREPLADTDVILENIMASICGSDKWLYPMGGDIRRPQGCQFGHELTARVIAKGKDVPDDIEIGKRYYPLPCNVKANRGFAGRPGGYSELIVCENAQKNFNLYDIPDNVSDEAASMIEPFTVGFRSSVTSKAKPGDRCVVFGAGPIGLAAAIGLREMGVEDILIINRSKDRLKIAEGLDKAQPFDTFSTLDGDWVEYCQERYGTVFTQTGPAIDVDVWIEACGHKETLEGIYDNCKFGARISVVSVHHKKVELDLRKLTWSQVELLGSAGYRPDDVISVINAMASGRYDIDSILTHTFPFEKFDEAIEFSLDGSKCLKVAVDYRMKD